MHQHRLLTFLTLTVIACLAVCPRAASVNSKVTLIYSFTNGLSPNAGVAIGANGSFYGTTATGGPGNYGGIYEVTSNGVLTNLIWLDGTNGADPVAPLVQDKSGNFYGTASPGSVNTNGTIFKMTSAGQFLWRAQLNNTDGSTPLAPLLAGTNGYFYGTTLNGGSNNGGTIFRVSSMGALTSVYSFSGSNGANPLAALIQGSDGNLYGTTAYGGDDGLGLSNGTFEPETKMGVDQARRPLGYLHQWLPNFLTASSSAWTKPPASYLPSGMLTISDSGPALDFVVSIVNSTLLAKPGSSTNSLTGVFYPKTGLLKITFGNGTRKDTATGYAAILGDSTNGGGYFVTKTSAGTITLAP